MTDIERILDQLGVRAQPTPTKQPTSRPPGPSSQWPGIWYRDGDIPH
jgi:hypothetical protein